MYMYLRGTNYISYVHYQLLTACPECLELCPLFVARVVEQTLPLNYLFANKHKK